MSDDHLSCALNFELPADGQLPEWVELIPAPGTNYRIDGRDGRHWFMRDPQAVIQQSQNQQRDIVGDWEHASELKAPKGEEAPAAFWIKELEQRNGAIWGRIEFTPRGEESVRNKEYRYLSPVFDYHRTTLEIYRLKSVGLTNKHNLYLSALNQEQTQPNQPEENPMLLSEAIRKALGLPEGATEEDATALIAARNQELQTAKNQAQTPSLDKFVPRTDYDTAMNRANDAETKLQTHLTTARNQEVEELVGQAVKDGKIAPASKDYYITACNQENGVENFKKFIETAPVIGADSNLDGKKPKDDAATAMNAEEKQIAAMFGNSAEDLAEFGK
ncbi:MAG: hypothetical protein HWE39_12830 [Oceanospirillaceae bacterium]|nr:hypothetical protein [Oceanospirillaceae bacterium]